LNAGGLLNPGARREKARESWALRFFRHPLVVAAFYASALVFAEILDLVRNSDNSVLYATAAGLALLLLLIVVGVSTLFFRIGREQEFDSKIEDMKEFINAQHMGWIVNEKYIRALEFGSPETWVFTRKLINDINSGGEIIQAVRANLAAGNKYVYFVPESPEAFETIDKYRRVHRFKPGQVTFYLIPESRFLFYTEVVVYNVGENERVGIEWLPQESLNYYIAMDPRTTDHVVGIGRMLMSSFPAMSEPGSAQIAIPAGESAERVAQS